MHLIQLEAKFLACQTLTVLDWDRRRKLRVIYTHKMYSFVSFRTKHCCSCCTISDTVISKLFLVKKNDTRLIFIKVKSMRYNPFLILMFVIVVWKVFCDKRFLISILCCYRPFTPVDFLEVTVGKSSSSWSCCCNFFLCHGLVNQMLMSIQVKIFLHFFWYEFE